MSYRDDVLANNPILYFEFEETSGSVVVDSSPNGLDGVVDTTDGLVTRAETGEHGLCYGFHPVGGVEGSIGPVVVQNTAPWPSLNAMDKILIEAWVKQSTTSGNQRICETGTTGISGEVFVIITSSTVWFSLLLSGGYQDMTWTHAGEPSDGDWHLLQCDYDGTDMHIYWDGDLKATESHPGQTVNYSEATEKYTIGWKGHGGAPGDGDTFDGLIDDFALYPIALADKITAPPPSLLTGRDSIYWDELGFLEAAAASACAGTPQLTFKDAAYTYHTAASPEGVTVNLPDTDSGDLLAVFGYGETISSVDLADDGWNTDGFPDGQPFFLSTRYLLTTFRVCDGSEGATDSAHFATGVGWSYWVVLSFSPSAALPAATQLQAADTAGWWPGSALANSPTTYGPDEDVFTGASGVALQFGNACGCGFSVGVNFFDTPGGTITYEGIVTDEGFTIPLGDWAGGSDIQTEVASSYQWYNNSDADPSDEFATDLWHSDASSGSIAVSLSLTYPQDCP